MEHRMKQSSPPWGRGVTELGTEVTALPVISLPFVSADYKREIRTSPKQSALSAQARGEDLCCAHSHFLDVLCFIINSLSWSLQEGTGAQA